MFSSYDNNDDEVKDIDNDIIYSEMEDIKDRGVIVIDNNNININNNVQDKKGIEKIKNDKIIEQKDLKHDDDVNKTDEVKIESTEDRTIITNIETPIMNVETPISNYKQKPQRDYDDRRRFNSSNRSFKKPYGSQPYSSQQPCIFWMSGICRFGQGCHYLHSVPQQVSYTTPPSLAPPSETVKLTSYVTANSETTIKEVEVNSDDQNKKKKKSIKSNTKTKDKDDIILPISAVSPKKKGKKKIVSKSEHDQFNSTIDSSIIELPKQSTEVDDSKLCEEIETVLKLDEQSSDTNDSSSYEEIFLDLFKNSPKHFLQLIKLNEKTYISEEIANRILSSRNKDSSLQSLQNIITEFQLRIKKRDFIALNKDILLAYYKQNQEVKNQISLTIQEKESQSKEIDENSNKTEDVDYHEIESNDPYSNNQSSYDNYKHYSTSTSSNPASYTNTSNYPSTNNENDSGNQGQMYIPPNDEVYYYTYVNPVNGLQYIYPSSGLGSMGYPNISADQIPIEYMNPYMYYPPMEYYPDIYSQTSVAPVLSNPPQLIRSREATILSPSINTSPSVASASSTPSTQDDLNAFNMDHYPPAYDMYYNKNPRNTVNNRGFYGRRGYGINYGAGRRDANDVRPYPYSRGGGNRRRYDQQQIPLGRGDARQQQFQTSTASEPT